MSGFYNRVFEKLPAFLRRRIHPLEHAVLQFVRQAANGGGGRVVLDAGAGESRFASLFADDIYIALDSKVGDPSWDYTAIQLWADVEALPLRSSSVDIVLNTQVLEHVRCPEKVLREFSRVLKAGGQLFLTAPQGWHEHQQPHDFFRFTRFALNDLLIRAGFEQATIEPMGGYFHYLGHRLTYVPKVLFQDRIGGVRWLLFPIEIVSLCIFCALLPLTCYYLDSLDRKREFTLCYQCRAQKRSRSGCNFVAEKDILGE